MADNWYYEKLKQFRDLLSKQIAALFDEYGDKLSLFLGNCNLLKRHRNCIESSTAMGYLLEEFLVSKLEELSHSDKNAGFLLESYSDGTSTRSSDCYATFGNFKILINVKTEKRNSVNYAIAAINQLEKDYCSDYRTEQAYLILKVRFDYIDTELGRQITIDRAPIIQYLEEYDYSRGHKQDHRRWSDDKDKINKENNSRLILSPSFTKAHNMPESAISSALTKKQLSLLNTEHGRMNGYIMPADCWPNKENAFTQ